MGHPIQNPEDALAFIRAGRAKVTIRSAVTSKRYTFKVTRKDDIWFYSLLISPDEYIYLATAFGDTPPRLTKKSPTNLSAPFAAIRWVMGNLLRGKLDTEQVEVWHEGHCGKCGRSLTVPESIESGLGPICRKAS